MITYPNPCHHCVAPKRHVGCRATCPGWLDYEAHANAERAEREVRINAFMEQLGYDDGKQHHNYRGSLKKFVTAKRNERGRGYA